MVIHTLLWPDEIRDPDFPVLDKEVEIKPAELKMAGQVVESMTDDFHPERFERHLPGTAARSWSRRRLEGGEAFTIEEAEPEELDETEDVSDLLAKLEASVKARRGGGSSDDGQAKKAPAKKAAAKKAPAKKTAAKKAAKKAPAKKTAKKAAAKK